MLKNIGDKSDPNLDILIPHMYSYSTVAVEFGISDFNFNILTRTNYTTIERYLRKS